jgi:ParB-like chromosome segregation protein Spo0J
MSNGKVLQVVLIPAAKISYQTDSDFKRFQQLGTETYVESVKELAANIAAIGLLNPIQVIKANGGYVVVAGNRRLTACREILGMTEIPCFVKSESNFIIAFSEQMQRTDLTEVERGSWIDKAIDNLKTIEPYKDSKTATQDIMSYLSRILGKAPRTLQQWRGMSKKFTPEEKAKVLAGESAYMIDRAKAAVSDDKGGKPSSKDPAMPPIEKILTAEQIAMKEAEKAEKEKGKILNKKANSFIAQSDKIRETIAFIAENALEFKSRKEVLGSFKALQKAMAVLEVKLAKDKPIVNIDKH